MRRGWDCGGACCSARSRRLPRLVLAGAAPKAEAAARRQCQGHPRRRGRPAAAAQPVAVGAAPIAAKSTPRVPTIRRHRRAAGPGRDDVDPIGALIAGASDALRGMGLPETPTRRGDRVAAPAVVVPLAPSRRLNVDRAQARAEAPRRRRPRRRRPRRLTRSPTRSTSRSSTGWSRPAAMPTSRSARIAEVGQAACRTGRARRCSASATSRRSPARSRRPPTVIEALVRPEARSPTAARCCSPAPIWRPGGASDAAARHPRRSGATASFPRSTETPIRKEFGGLLTAGDHKARMDRLLYDEQHGRGAARRRASSTRTSRRSPRPSSRSSRSSRRPARRSTRCPGRDAQGPALHLCAHPGSAPRRQDQRGRRRCSLSAPRDPKRASSIRDAWWVERRLISRALIDAGRRQAPPTRSPPATRPSPARCAPRPSSTPAGTRSSSSTIRRPPRQHFAAIAARSRPMPLSQSRAEYWLGRAAAAAGNQRRGGRPLQARRRLSDHLLRPARPRPPRRQAARRSRRRRRPTPRAQSRFDDRELVQVDPAPDGRRPRAIAPTSSTATSPRR